jgi:CBS domain-containing protein
MTVGKIVGAKGREVITVLPTQPVAEVVAVLCAKRIGAVVVCDAKGEMVGVLSERDIVRDLGAVGAALLTKTAADIMTSPVITCTPAHTVAEAMALMTSRRFRHLPVIDNGALVGVVSIGDLVKERIEEAEREAEALKSYIVTG